MEAEGIAPSAISAFESTFSSLVSGNTGLIGEDTISPVPDLDKAEDFSSSIKVDTSLLKETVMLKLNGGLGTGMGLDKAKSLLTVKGQDTFLDLTAKQVIQMRKDYGEKVKFMLMNSFSTSKDTLDFLRSKYPALTAEEGLEMLQNKVPKIDAETLVVCTVVHSSFAVLLQNKTSNSISPFLVINFKYHQPYSPLLVPATQTTNGAHPVMVISTLPWSVPVALTVSSKTDSSTCSSPTRITSEPLSIWPFSLTLLKRELPS